MDRAPLRGAMANPIPFRNPSVAETITELLRRQSAELNAALEAIEPACSESEFTAYADAIGGLMGAMYSGVLQPIWEAFPELCPDEVLAVLEDPGDSKPS